MQTSPEFQLRRACDLVLTMLENGDSHVSEKILADHPLIAADAEAAIEVIYAEIVAREEAGEAFSVSEYTERFPEFSARIQRLMNVHAAFDAADRLTDAADQGSTATTADTDSAGDPEGEPRRSASQPRSGNRVGQYELLEEIGEGATGLVYRARQPGLDRDVAVKILRPFGSTESRARFRGEAESMAALRHPNIVQVHEFGTDSGCDFLAMELIRGGTLADALKQSVFDAKEAARFVILVSRAVHAAHQSGIIHRDLKPSNILLSQSGEPRITDFGLAHHGHKDAQLRTRTGAILGTPGYMAPEQLERSGDAGPAADVYSIGAILYELLTGRPPYHAASILEILDQMRAADPLAPRRLRPDVPADLNNICLNCLERVPERRYTSAELLADDLNRFLDGRTVSVRATSLTERTWKWVRRRPLVAGLLSALMLITVVGAAGIAWQWRNAETRREKAEQASVAANLATQDANQARENERQSRERTEWALYYQRIATAHQESLNGDTFHARQILDQCEPFRRGWEWKYLNGLLTANVLTLSGHSQPIRTIAFDPRGRFVAAGSDSAAAGDVSSVILWSLESGREVWRSSHAGGVRSVSFSPDGERLLVAFTRGVEIVRSDSGESVDTLLSSSSVWGGRFSPDGQRVAVASDRRVRVFDSVSGQMLSESPVRDTSIFEVAWHPAHPVVAACWRDGRVTIHDAETAEVRETLLSSADTRILSFSPDGQWLICSGFAGGAGLLRVWKYDDNQFTESATIRDPTDSFLYFAASPDARSVAYYGSRGNVRLLNLQAQQQSVSFPGASRGLSAAAFGTDARLLAVGGHDCRVHVSDRSGNDGSLIRRRGNRIVKLCEFLPDSSVVALAGGNAQTPRDRATWVDLWDVRTNTLVKTLTGTKGDHASLAVNTESNRVACGGADGTVTVWDCESGDKLWQQREHTSSVIGIAFRNPPADPESTVHFVSLDETGLMLFQNEGAGGTTDQVQLDSPRLTTARFSEDGSFVVAVDRAGTVRVFSVTDGRLLDQLPPDAGTVRVVALSSSGMIGTASEDRIVRTWSVSDLSRPLFSFSGHDAPVAALAYNRDGSRLLSCGDDGSMRLWDTAHGHQALHLQHIAGGIHCAAFSTDGRWIVRGRHSWLKVLDAQPPRRLGGGQPVSADVTRQVRDWHLGQAEVCRESGNVFGARLHLRSVVESSVTDSPADVLRTAKQLHELGETSLAATQISRILERWTPEADDENTLADTLRWTYLKANELLNDGRLDDARLLLETRGLADRLLTDRFSVSARIRDSIAGQFRTAGHVLRRQGELDAALVAYDKSIPIWRDLRHEDASNPDYAVALANALLNKASLLRAMGRGAEDFIPLSEEAVKLDRGALDVEPERMLFMTEFRLALSDLYIAYDAADRHDDAVTTGETLVSINERIVARSPNDRRSVHECARASNNLAWRLVTGGSPPSQNPKRAVELATRAVTLRNDSAAYWNTLALAELRAGDWSAAVDAAQKSIELTEGGSSLDWLILAIAIRFLGDHDQADKWLAAAEQIAESEVPEADRAVHRSLLDEARLKRSAPPQVQETAPARTPRLRLPPSLRNRRKN